MSITLIHLWTHTLLLWTRRLPWTRYYFPRTRSTFVGHVLSPGHLFSWLGSALSRQPFRTLRHMWQTYWWCGLSHGPTPIQSDLCSRDSAAAHLYPTYSAQTEFIRIPDIVFRDLKTITTRTSNPEEPYCPESRLLSSCRTPASEEDASSERTRP